MIVSVWRKQFVAIILLFGTRASALDLHVVRSLDLPLVRAHDVRWIDATHALVAAGYDTGSATVDVTTGQMQPIVTAHRADRWSYNVAISGHRMFYAAPLNSLGWITGDKQVITQTFTSPNDIDAFGDDIAVFGTRRDASGRYAPEGAIVWLGHITDDSVSWRPLMFSDAGAGARPFAFCKTVEIGAVRYLPDGSILVVPGIQPGASLYDHSGKLVATWQTEGMGFVDQCTVSEDQWQANNRDIERRWQWINSHVVLDEILAFPHPALIIRRRAGAQTKWDLIQLLPNGKYERSELPVTASSPHCRLHGDVQNGRFVFLLSEEDPMTTRVHPRLVIGEVRH